IESPPRLKKSSCKQVVSRMKRAGYVLQPKDLFNYPTLGQLANFVGEEEALGKYEQGMLSGASGLLPIQQRFLQMGHKQAAHYNQALLIQVNKSVNTTFLAESIACLVQHHDALRFQYQKQGRRYAQYYGADQSHLKIEDLSTYSLEDYQAKLAEYGQNLQQSLSLQSGALTRFVFVKTPESLTHHRLLIVAHHLLIDGVSWRILLEDLERCLHTLNNGQQPKLGDKTMSYREWHQYLESYAQNAATESQRAYWTQLEKAYRPIPVDYDRRVEDRSSLHTLSFQLDKIQTQQLLKEANRAYKTNINDILLSALVKTIYQWSGYPQVMIGLEGHGREAVQGAADLSKTIGWFTSLFPVLLQIEEDLTEPAIIKSTKEQLRAIPDKGMGYACLKYLSSQTQNGKSFEQQEPWDILFNYLGQVDAAFTGNLLEGIAPESLGHFISPKNQPEAKLAINGAIHNGALKIEWTYSCIQYKEHTVDQLGTRYLNNLIGIIDHCLEQKTSNYTPSDFKLNDRVHYRQLDHFLNRLAKEKMGNSAVMALYPLSPVQQGLLFHSLYEEETKAYVNCFIVELSHLDVDVLKQAWEEVIHQHSILRTAFFHEYFEWPLQGVFDTVQLPFEQIDIRQLTRKDQNLCAVRYF
ncbi:MAG: condensation domain-containing protein, partial [Bacteroidota bacterium]